VVDQAADPPVGSVDVHTLPRLSNATQYDAVAQDTFVRVHGKIGMTCHAPAPSAGSVVVATLPLLAVATHRAVDGHDTPVKNAPVPLRRWVGGQADAPPVGSVDARTSPESSAATHSEMLAHDTADKRDFVLAHRRSVRRKVAATPVLSGASGSAGR